MKNWLDIGAAFPYLRMCTGVVLLIQMHFNILPSIRSVGVKLLCLIRSLYLIKCLSCMFVQLRHIVT